MTQTSVKQVFLLLPLLLLSVPVKADILTIDVIVKSVDIDERVVTVGTKIKDLKLEVAKKAEILVDGEVASLKQIVPGQPVTISYESMLEIVTRIEVGGASIEQVKPLQGIWLMMAEEAGGKRIKKAEVKEKKKTLKVDGDRFSLSTISYEITGKLKLIPEEGTNAIDFEGKFVKGGKGQSVVLKGIFEITGDTLKICYSYNDENKKSPRPTAFETEEGSPGIGMTMQKTD
ncbi:MAG TPA: TIGR03067 domain-containing protein [Planctomicrobium sp.]|nr:TIGR03067 domain-containing protein [Planctomicrobium sp.]